MKSSLPLAGSYRICRWWAEKRSRLATPPGMQYENLHMVNHFSGGSSKCMHKESLFVQGAAKRTSSSKTGLQNISTPQYWDQGYTGCYRSEYPYAVRETRNHW
ncbi:hypothetical protein FRC02_008593 [Tulasnella sp. 418]|nr:hypothetical protein FRC02_008593 [Tulasnella sp. 418]